MKLVNNFVLTAMSAPLALACGSAFAAQYLSVEQAQQVIFPEANAFKPSTLSLNLEQMQQVEKLAGISARSVAWRIISAYQGDKLLGHIVLDDVIGKFELISYAVGLQLDASVRQVEILTYRESHGFEIKNANWRKQFVGKNVSAGLKVGEGVANISGATLSCAHVTDGVRRIAAIAQIVLKK